MNIKLLILALAFLSLFSSFVLAVGTQNSEEVQIITGTTLPSNAVKVGNKICPVSGDKVPVLGEKGAMGDKQVKIEYRGKIYNLCCPMCIKDFKKNPEKYSAIADKEVRGQK